MLATLLETIQKDATTWFVGALISILAVFSGFITERIKFAINKANLRSQYFEQIALSLSAFIFHAELIQEFQTERWTDSELYKQIVTDYNKLITEIRSKNYIFSSWIATYWQPSRTQLLEDVFEAVKAVDKNVHSFNDGNRTPEKIQQLLTSLEKLRPLAHSLLSKP